MIIGVHHTAISVPDLDKALDFYCNVLGFEKLSEGGWDRDFPEADAIIDEAETAGRSAMLKGANTHIEFFEFANPRPEPKDPNYPVINHGITHFCLQVDDCEAEYARLATAGMRFHCPPQHMDGTVATYGRDPFGNVIEIYEINNDAPRLGADAKPV